MKLLSLFPLRARPICLTCQVNSLRFIVAPLPGQVIGNLTILPGLQIPLIQTRPAPLVGLSERRGRPGGHRRPAATPTATVQAAGPGLPRQPPGERRGRPPAGIPTGGVPYRPARGRALQHPQCAPRPLPARRLGRPVRLYHLFPHHGFGGRRDRGDGDIAIPRWFGQIEGTVYHDANQNGCPDPGERGIPLVDVGSSPSPPASATRSSRPSSTAGTPAAYTT